MVLWGEEIQPKTEPEDLEQKRWARKSEELEAKKEEDEEKLDLKPNIPLGSPSKKAKLEGEDLKKDVAEPPKISRPIKATVLMVRGLEGGLSLRVTQGGVANDWFKKAWHVYRLIAGAAARNIPPEASARFDSLKLFGNGGVATGLESVAQEVQKGVVEALFVIPTMDPDGMGEVLARLVASRGGVAFLLSRQHPFAKDVESLQAAALLRLPTEERYFIKKSTDAGVANQNQPLPTSAQDALQNELKLALRALGTPASLQDQNSIPTLTQSMLERFLPRLKAATFHLCSQTFNKSRVKAHRKAIMYSLAALLKKKGTLNEEMQQAFVQSFLFQICSSVRGGEVDERDIYKKLLQSWTKMKVLKHNDLQKLKNDWDFD